MSELLDFARKNPEKLLKPFGEFDVLLFYSIAAKPLTKFLHRKEIAAKVWFPPGKIPFVLKRGSLIEPLSAEELSEAVTLDLLELRASKDLKDVEENLSKEQKKVWQYFVPRRLADFFYATNNEGAGKPVDRIFFDIDRGEGITLEQSLEVTRSLVKIIKEDEALVSLIGNAVEPFVSWTGNSFHVYIFLDKERPNSFYDKYFHYSKDEPSRGFTAKWVGMLETQTGLKINGGHDEKKEAINIDPSQTPSGKLARSPLGSLHMSDYQIVNGVSIPISEKMLKEKDLPFRLSKLRLIDVITNLEKYSKNLPERFQV